MNPVRSQFAARFHSRGYAKIVALCGLVIAALLTGNSSAEATCGDYLHGQMSNHDSAATGIAAAYDLDPAKFQITADRSSCPCKGIACKRGPTKSPLPTSVIQFEHKDQWMEGALLKLTLNLQSPQYPRRSELFQPPMIAYRLDRPPKA